jgi:hypothetical protein
VRTAEANIDGKAYTGKAPLAEKGLEYAWAPLGKVVLDANKPAIAISGKDIAAIVLSSEADFDPKRFVKDTRVYEDPIPIADARATDTRNLNTVQMMPRYTKETWEATRDQIRRRMLIACGLWPMPEKTPLNAKIFDRVERDGYSVEKVYFEARPGFLVTGNLYRPLGNGPFPAVACPHGHWKTGRLENTDTCSVPGRCITLARMGIVSFSYDMLGYNDSLQFEHNLMNPELSLWGIHSFSLQLWSSIRVLDFLEELPYVDKERLACTGASGGGTQTFALCAVDDRVKVSAPVNMISCSMQGGCVCENAPLIRLGVSNMEIGATMAPRPMLMVSATGDWTRETPRVEYPAIKEIYALYGAEGNVENHHVDAGHNYNKESREAMYRFFGKHLLGGDWSTYTEPPFEVEPVEKLRVFPDDKLPEGLPTALEIIERIKKERDATWLMLVPRTEETLGTYREAQRRLLSDLTGAVPVSVNDLVCERVSFEERTYSGWPAGSNGYVVEKWMLGHKDNEGRIPAILQYRRTDSGPQPVAVRLHSEGKAKYARDGDVLSTEVERFLTGNHMVLTLDPFLVGEQQGCFVQTKRTSVTFLDTYQPTDTGYRVQDVLTAIAFLRSRRDVLDQVTLYGKGNAGLWATLASGIDGRAPVAVDELWDARESYIPGFTSVGGMRTALTLLPDFKVTPDSLQFLGVPPTP